MPVPRLGVERVAKSIFWFARSVHFHNAARCMVKWMSDPQFRLATLAGAFVLVVLIAYLRFCGSVSLPTKPPPPSGPMGTQTQLLGKSSASPAVYKSYLDSDAAAAGVPAPSPTQMATKLSYRVDEARHVLEPGKPPLEAAGLRIRVERASDSIITVIENKLDSAVAYNVVTQPSTGAGSCNSVTPLPYNAMVIAKGGSERRTECAYREGMAIIVTKIETIEVGPLSAHYLSQVPPSVVGIDGRLARGHRGVQGTNPCSPVVPQVVRTGLERGEIGWRDLADFYARHRCQTYPFPASYRAFKSDGAFALPVVVGG